MGDVDPREQLAALNTQIAAVGSYLNPLLARRQELLSVLDGPRVIPVLVCWSQGQRFEHECPSVDVAFALAAEMVENNTGWGEHVLIGGAVLTEDEWEADRG